MKTSTITTALLLLLLGLTEAARGGAQEIRSKEEFDRIIARHALTGLPVVVDYYSESCGPCRQIAPRYNELAREYQDKAVFLKVNVQTNPQVASNIRSMPTFRFYVNGKQKHQFSGADEGQLRRYTADYSRAAFKKPHPIREVKTRSVFKSLLRDAGGVPVVVAFVEKGNDDCKMIYPVFKELHKANIGKAIFAKVYPKENIPTAEMCKVATGDVPITQIYVSGKKEAEVVGPNDAQLREKVAEVIAARAARRGKKKKDKGGEEPTPCKEYKPPVPSRPQTRTPLRLAMAPLAPEKVVIIGAGPAGLSAAIYAARAGLKPVVIAPDMGGQLMFTKEVENYPALVDGTGPALMDLMRVQAESFGTEFEATMLVHADLSQQPFVLTLNTSKHNEIKTNTLIIATGADARWLGVPGEQQYRAKGISSCATCDGYLFKDKEVIVVGGGDTAMEEALFLARICSAVTIVHRRDTFRASYILQQRVLTHAKIKVLWNHQVKEFKGEEYVSTAVVQHVSTKETQELKLDAVFVAIGHDPNTNIFRDQGVKMDGQGYILLEGKSTMTSVEGVFAAGDVADSVYRQAVTSAASGAMASLDAERYLNEHGEVEEGASFADVLSNADFSSWSVKMLKAVMKEQNLSTKGCLEKKDFIDRLKTYASQNAS